MGVLCAGVPRHRGTRIRHGRSASRGRGEAPEGSRWPRAQGAGIGWRGPGCAAVPRRLGNAKGASPGTKAHHGHRRWRRQDGSDEMVQGGSEGATPSPSSQRGGVVRSRHPTIGGTTNNPKHASHEVRKTRAMMVANYTTKSRHQVPPLCDENKKSKIMSRITSTPSERIKVPWTPERLASVRWK